MFVVRVLKLNDDDDDDGGFSDILHTQQRRQDSIHKRQKRSH